MCWRASSSSSASADEGRRFLAGVPLPQRTLWRLLGKRTFAAYRAKLYGPGGLALPSTPAANSLLDGNPIHLRPLESALVRYFWADLRVLLTNDTNGDLHGVNFVVRRPNHRDASRGVP